MKIQHVQEVILYLPSLSLHLALLNTLFDFQISNLCKQMIETLSTAILRARLLVWRLSKWENARLEILISIKLPTRRALVKLPLTKLQQVSAQKVEEVERGELLRLNFPTHPSPKSSDIQLLCQEEDFTFTTKLSEPAHHLCLCNCTHSGKPNSFGGGREKKKISPVRVCHGHAYLIDINVFVSTKIIDGAAAQIEIAPRFPDSPP